MGLLIVSTIFFIVFFIVPVDVMSMICNVQDVQDMYMNVSICNITMWHLCVKSYVLWCPCVGATTLSLCVRPEGDACITLGYNKGLVLCILLISLQQCSSHNIILNSGGKVNYWAVPYRHRICLCEQKDIGEEPYIYA